MARFNDDDEPKINQLPDPRPSEELLMRHASSMRGENLLATTQGRGQLANLLAHMNSSSNVTCYVNDYYTSKILTEYNESLTPNLTIICTSDLPEPLCEHVAIPLSKSGEAEYSRDLLQQGLTRLTERGTLWASVDNPEDKWLIGEMQKLSNKVSIKKYPQGVVYSVKRPSKYPKLKDFSAKVVMREKEDLLSFETRPGIFAHRQIDLGAKALLDSLPELAGRNILDIGSGSGVCGIVASLRNGDPKVLAIDSNPRAVAISKRNADQHCLKNYEAILACDADDLCEQERHPSSGWDLVLANPPYYSHYKISRLFVDLAHQFMHQQGRLFLVTKFPEWYLAYLPLLFDEIKTHEARGYIVLEALQPDKSACVVE